MEVGPAPVEAAEGFAERFAEGFDGFFREYYRPAVRLASLLTGDGDRAEDVVCEAFARVYPRWKRGRVDDVGAYVRRTVVNAVRGSWRHRAVERRHAHEVASPAAATNRFEEVVDDREAMWQMLRQLPEGQRRVIVLRFYGFDAVLWRTTDGVHWEKLGG